MFNMVVYDSKEILSSEYEQHVLDNAYNLHNACFKRLSKIDRVIQSLKLEKEILLDIYNSLDSTIKFDND